MGWVGLGSGGMGGELFALLNLPRQPLLKPHAPDFHWPLGGGVGGFAGAPAVALPGEKIFAAFFFVVIPWILDLL